MVRITGLIQDRLACGGASRRKVFARLPEFNVTLRAGFRIHCPPMHGRAASKAAAGSQYPF
jgi:hypothetical protein